MPNSGYEMNKAIVRTAPALAMGLGLLAGAVTAIDVAYAAPPMSIASSRTSLAPQPWPGPQDAFVFVEGEDFQIDGAGWRVVEDAGTRNEQGSSGFQAISGAGRGDGMARIGIQAPVNGRYKAWVRHSRFARQREIDRGPFLMTVRQNDKVVLEQEIDRTYDGEVRPGGGPPLPPYVWHAAEVDLVAGPATIELRKVGPLATNAHVRKIDCLLLTTDLKHEADHRDYGPQTYMRVHLHRADDPATRVFFSAMFHHMRAPFYNRAVFDASGSIPGVTFSPPTGHLSPGQSTPWLNVTRLLDSGLSPEVRQRRAGMRQPGMDTNLELLVMVRPGGGGPAQVVNESAFTVDFATAPSLEAVVKTLRRDGPGAGMHVRMGPRLDEDTMPRSDLEIATQTREIAESLPPVTFGRRPTTFPMMTDFSRGEHNHTPGTHGQELAVMARLGINGKANPPLTQADVDAGVLFGRWSTAIWFMGPGGFTQPKLDIMSRQIANRARLYHADPQRERYIYVKMMDEATATPLDRLAANPASQEAFRQWVRQQGWTLDRLGVNSWDEVKILPQQDPDRAGLYVASQRFRAGTIVDFFATARSLVHEHFGSDVRSTQNFSDGSVYAANLYAQGNDYFTWFRRKALDLALSEDWSALGSTPQCGGWNVALLRSATKYHGQPIGMYVISYGSLLDTKLRAYSDVAQGAKSLNFYCYGPLYIGHEPGWSRTLHTHQAIAELTREIGAAEHVLLDAMPVQARTAIIYSTSSDIWDVRRDNGMGHERMHTYIAMRHGQIAVDVLSEEDVVEGWLDGYATAYLFGDQVDQRACKPLGDWVKAGGTLVLAAGAGQRDELDRPMAELDEDLGLRRGSLERLQTMWTSGRGIDKALSRQGKVTLQSSGVAVDLLSRRQALTPGPGATVLARFEDGSPASLEQAAGRGRVVAHGFTPALAYVRAALLAAAHADQARPDDDEADHPPTLNSVEATMQAESVLLTRGASLVPPDFPAGLRDFILAPARDHAGPQPVSVDAPQVEATLLQGTQGWVVTLANYSGRPLQHIKVTIRKGARPSGTVHHSRGDALNDTDARTDVVEVTLPLESTDMVFAPWTAQ